MLNFLLEIGAVKFVDLTNNFSILFDSPDDDDDDDEPLAITAGDDYDDDDDDDSE